jgi:TonB family protein
MLVQATRAVSNVTLRAAFYVGLFMFVVAAQVGVTTALRAQGASAGLALLISGALVLAVVLGAHAFAGRAQAWRAERRVRAARARGLPEAACCLVWRGGESEDAPRDWRLLEPLRVRYPKLARRLGVEGMAEIAFEIGSDGRARHLHCLQAWPNDDFYRAASAALAQARFEPKRGVKPRMGAAHRLTFVFRIAGAAALADGGSKAAPARPAFQAARLAVERLRRAA